MFDKVKLEFKKQDVWIGVYWDSKNIWICLIPCFPINIKRTTICDYCHKPIKGDYSGFGYHDEIKNQKYSQYTDKLVTCREAQKIDGICDEECS